MVRAQAGERISFNPFIFHRTESSPFTTLVPPGAFLVNPPAEFPAHPQLSQLSNDSESRSQTPPNPEIKQKTNTRTRVSCKYFLCYAFQFLT